MMIRPHLYVDENGNEKPVHTDDWLDAKSHATDNPRFHLPSQRDLDSIGVGMAVKISNKRHRFWTRVSLVRGNLLEAKVSGLFSMESTAYKVGDYVRFFKRHVLDVVRKEDEELHVEAMRQIPAVKALAKQLREAKEPELVDKMLALAAVETSTVRTVARGENTTQKKLANELLERRCVHCSKPKAKHVCPVCFVRYCSAECQNADWAAHKPVCKNPLEGSAPLLTRQEKKLARKKRNQKKIRSQQSTAEHKDDAEVKDDATAPTDKQASFFGEIDSVD